MGSLTLANLPGSWKRLAIEGEDSYLISKLDPISPDSRLEEANSRGHRKS